MIGLRFFWIAAEDPRMQHVHALRHEALFAPFGLERNDNWDDVGDDRRHLVAMIGDEVVGYTCLIKDPDRTAHLRQVCVRPDMQGTGIGRALMAEAEAEAQQLGLSQMWLNARVSAEPFYHRCGWKSVGGQFPHGRTGVLHVRMEKRPGA